MWDMLQEELTLLCVTAVEDKLQADVRATLERLRSANVRTWMLTGDKLETAKVIAQNASLVRATSPSTAGGGADGGGGAPSAQRLPAGLGERAVPDFGRLGVEPMSPTSSASSWRWRAPRPR